MLADLDQSLVVLQLYGLNPDGSEKTDIVSGAVRVYSIVSGSEVDILAATPLVHVGGSKWRYNWLPAALPVGQYVVEYDLVDSRGQETLVAEDLIVRDIAEQAMLADVHSRVILLQDDLAIVRKVETGRWRIVDNQMIFYDDDATTQLLVFNLYDEASLPSMERVFERRRTV